MSFQIKRVAVLTHGAFGMLLHVFPVSPPNDAIYCRSAYFVSIRQLAARSTAFDAFSNVAHRIVSKLGVTITLASGVSILVFHVAHVVCGCANEHVRRIGTGRVITTMAKMRFVRDWAMRVFPRHPMAQSHFPASDVLPVPVRTQIASPRPAVGGASALVYLRPKALLQLFIGEAFSVSVDKPTWLTFDPTFLCAVDFGEWRLSATTAMAQTSFHRRIIGDLSHKVKHDAI